MALTREQVEYTAHLARLAIDPQDIPHMTQELSAILNFVEQMNQVETTNIVPMSHPLDVGQRLRPDVVTEADAHTLLQSIAPLVQAGFYLVPQFVE